MNHNLKRIVEDARKAYLQAAEQSVFDAYVLSYASWGSQQGYLLSFNDLKELLDAVDTQTKETALPEAGDVCYVWGHNWPKYYNSGNSPLEKGLRKRRWSARSRVATGESMAGSPCFVPITLEDSIMENFEHWDNWKRVSEGLPDYMLNT